MTKSVNYLIGNTLISVADVLQANVELKCARSVRRQTAELFGMTYLHYTNVLAAYLFSHAVKIKPDISVSARALRSIANDVL